MTMRKSSLTPMMFAIFLFPVAIPVFFAMLSPPWSNGARAQEEPAGIKRAVLPSKRPIPAPLRSGTFPNQNNKVTRRAAKSNEFDRTAQAQRPSPKVGVQVGSSSPRATSVPNPVHKQRVTANARPQKSPLVQQTAIEKPQRTELPSGDDFVDTEQRSQEVRRTLEIQDTPDYQNTVEVEVPQKASRPAYESEVEIPSSPQPQLTETEPISEPTPEPIEEPARGVMNAYFEEPFIEEPLVFEETPFEEEESPEEDLPFERPLRKMVAEEPEDEAFFEEAVVQNKTDPVKSVPPANATAETIDPPSVAPPAPTQPPAKPKWFTDLRAINTIDVREAVQIPPIAAGDSANILQPDDQANAFLSQRPAVNFSTAYWAPWQADRDTYPFCHYPLYFEDPNLERCGRGWSCFTTFVSLGRFYANVPFLPYRVTAEPHLCRVRSLPDCPACHKFGYDVYLPPWSWKAAAVQAAAYAGAIYIVP